MTALISKLKTMMHTYNPNQCPYPTINFLHLTVSEILPGQNFKGQGHYGKIKDQIKVNHKVAYLQPLTSSATRCQLPKPYGFQDIARTRFYRSRSLCKIKDQIKVTPRCCTPTTPNQCPYHVSTSNTLQFLRYSADKIVYVRVTTARKGHLLLTPYSF